MMFEFKSIAEARDFFDTLPHSADADKFYVSAIQVYFSAFKLCPECEVKFKQKRKDQIYCHKKCGDRVRARDYRTRKKAKVMTCSLE